MIDRLHVFVAETELGEGTGPIVLDHDVRAGNETLQNASPGFGFQIQRDRSLVRRLRQVAGSHGAAVELTIRPLQTRLVELGRMLDLNDVGTEQAKLI